MQFRFRDAPEWFGDHLLTYYIDELHKIQKKAQTLTPNFDDIKFKQLAVKYFSSKGFTAWLDENNQLWFDVDPDSAKWTFEILRN
jgi:hypothetical protein